MKKVFSLMFVQFFLVGIIVACSSIQTLEAPALTPPAVGLEITGDDCPSVEVQTGMQIAWTNLDDVNHTLILERQDDYGVVVDSGGTDLLQPGSTFSITLTEPGQYTYYCSQDKDASGTITVLP
jgi:hypothetical protein